MKYNCLFYFCEGIGSVFDSQVLALLQAINEKKYFKKIFLFLGIRNEIQKYDFFDKKINNGIESIFFNTSPNYPFFNIYTRKALTKVLKHRVSDIDKAVFHTRGEVIALHLSKILDKAYQSNIIPDIRGTSIEEINEFYDLNKFQKFFKTYNNKKALQNLNKFNKISVVSESLKKYLINNHKINADKIFITPSLAGKRFKFNNKQRENVRTELKLGDKDKLIVFSSGGTASWQNNDALLILADNGIKVLNLSKKEIHHKNIINRFVTYDEMPSYLNAADAAIIWRDKNIVNEVASPVKFSEYICTGLPVIANNTVAMISEYIRKHQCGILVDDLSAVNLKMINDLSLKDRKKVSDEGIYNFGAESISEKYLYIYSSINKA